MPKRKTSKTIEEINRKIKQGKAVVVTADEMTDIVKGKGPEKAARGSNCPCLLEGKSRGNCKYSQGVD